jgi:ankyrin repeat protein
VTVTEKDKSIALGARLFVATMSSDSDALALIEQGAVLNMANSEGVTTLMSAAAEGSTKIVEAMLKSGRDVALNAQDHHGWTALMTAVHRDQPAVVRLLLEAGADMSVKDKMGRDVFFYGRENGAAHALLLRAIVTKEFARDATPTENPAVPARPLKLKNPGMN